MGCTRSVWIAGWECQTFCCLNRSLSRNIDLYVNKIGIGIATGTGASVDSDGAVILLSIASLPLVTEVSLSRPSCGMWTPSWVE